MATMRRTGRDRPSLLSHGNWAGMEALAGVLAHVATYNIWLGTGLWRKTYAGLVPSRKLVPHVDT
jgi:hypothetical protein